MPDHSGFPTLHRGHRDKAGHTFVKELQEALNEENACSLDLDGILGQETERQLLIFQGRAGLAVDGYVGAATWGALGFVDFLPPEEEFPDIEDWRGDYRRLLMRYQMLMWAGAPLFLAVQLWGAARDNPPSGSGWIGPAIIGAVFVPIWLMFGKLFLAFRTIFAGEEEQEKRTRLARIAERELAIRRAERLRNARQRLARIETDRQDAKSHRLALDIDRIRRELDVDDDGQAD